MTKTASRRGSALLIVLGMLSFMIISAIAFSAYMRYSRLPSSYLRRTDAARMLVRSAVARAIDEIDHALANNPHPGLGTETVDGTRHNYWKHRVFFGQRTTVSEENTAPVLTLEGLAYIPPPLVNDARYYSRRTPTAGWKSFGFDAGRYAYCALDVSDYFDINRLQADVARSSASNRRISLAQCFENATHTSPGSGAESWDTFMEGFRKVNDDTGEMTWGSIVPLVSLADLNLALYDKGGDSGVGGLSSPWCKYVWNQGDGFYDSMDDTTLEKFRNMTFLTDGLFTDPNGDSEAAKKDNGSDYDELYDLTYEQPFQASMTKKNANTTIRSVLTSGGRALVRLSDSLPKIGLLALLDYLDEDRVPLSLALPTVERVPMCCGIKPGFTDLQLKVNSVVSKVCRDDLCKTEWTQGAMQPEGTTETVYQKISYAIDPQGLQGLQGGVKALYAYPFAHEDGITGDKFTIDGRMSVFFSLDDKPVRLRTSNAERTTDVLHLTESFMNDKGVNGNGIINVPFDQAQFTPKQIDENPEDAVQEVVLGTKLAQGIGPSLAADQHPIMTITYRWNIVWKKLPNVGTVPTYTTRDQAAANTAESALELIAAHCGIPPIGADGAPVQAYMNDTSFLNLIKDGKGESVSLKVAFWTRVKDRDGKTVDLVPATVADDKTFNRIVNTDFPGWNKYCGQSWPLMKFDTDGLGFTYSVESLDKLSTAASGKLVPSAVMIDDPRFNAAPESWYTCSDVSASEWVKNNGAEGRDGDIFMATSDRGYLQSIYELAFLTRFSSLESRGDSELGSYKTPQDSDRVSFNAKGNDIRNEHLMWRTYSPFKTDNGDWDDFEGCGFTSAGTGFKVNPYSDSTNVIMSAFANTPVDWHCAATNAPTESRYEDFASLSAAEFNKKYAWNAYSSVQNNRISYDDLRAVASRLMSGVRNGRTENQDDAKNNTIPDCDYKDWLDVWEGLGWYDRSGDNSLAGHQLSGNSAYLWTADRKFLYGFWRECFAVRQQMFLVFVRAEPMMMGGGAMGRLPPQLGGRAVALVWRDPTKTVATATGKDNNPGYPHKTRILFYKQLD